MFHMYHRSKQITENILWKNLVLLFTNLLISFAEIQTHPPYAQVDVVIYGYEIILN